MNLTLLLKWIEEHPGLASWVQAFGSIAAIVASASIAVYATREARRTAWRTQRDAVDRFSDLAYWIAYELWPWGDKWKARPRLGMVLIVSSNLISRRKSATPFAVDRTSFGDAKAAMARACQGIELYKEQMAAADYPSIYDKEYAAAFVERLLARGAVVQRLGEQPGSGVPSDADVMMLCDWSFQDAIAAARLFTQKGRDLR